VPQVTRVPGRGQVLVVQRQRQSPPPRTAAALEAVYGPAFGGHCSASSREVTADAGRITMILVGATAPTLGDVVVWGEPVGVDGPASDAEVLAALAEPERARLLLGSFVLASLTDEGARLVTSSDLVHTLKHVAASGGEAWSTHGLAAVVAAGESPRLQLEVIPEVVYVDYAFGDDELLAGVRVLPEATVVEVPVHGGAALESSYWPVAERLQGASNGRALQDPTGLRLVVGSVLERMCRGHAVELALTAGRDSGLLAACLATAGLPVRCFTFGGDRTPDGAGAAAVAERLGLPHRSVVEQEWQPPERDGVLAAALWTEGLDTAWNIYGPPPPIDAAPEARLVFGVGGEMGRAIYWSALPEAERDDPVRAVTGWVQPLIPPAAGALLLSRAERFRNQLHDEGWQGTRLLDAWHARGRVRKWPAHSPPPHPPAVTIYTNAELAGTLLNIPDRLREHGQLWDAALGELRHLAVAAAGRQRARLRDRVAARVRGPVSARRALRLLRSLDLGDDSPVASVLGSSWYEDRLRDLRYDPAAHRMLWNALGIDAFAATLPGINHAIRQAGSTPSAHG
jgi:hypothetical protein